MQTTEVTPRPQFTGSAEDQAAAAEVFQIMRAMGRFYPANAPIRASLESLAGFMASRNPSRSAEEWRAELDRILTENATVFAREEREGQILFVTTQAGVPPVPQPEVDQAHTLARRFEEPMPLPERPPEARPRPASPTLPPAEAEAVQEAIEEAAATAPEAVARVTPPRPAEAPEREEVAPPPVERPAAPVATTDLAAASAEAIRDAIVAQLRMDVTVANFGDEWMAEDKVPRLSRGDLRRIRDYLLERNEPLSDVDLLQDVLGVRPGDPEYDLQRFALNFRLSREHREFEFVGTAAHRLWSTPGLPPIGTTKRKASEIGQDYRFLLEQPQPSYNPDETVAEHVLTFYEHQYGVLPLAGPLAALFPPALLPDQRAAVFVFESPQNYETFFVELRYPTGNRGGYLAGFERFFQENLVPGALITLERAEEGARFLIEYLPVSGQDRKLLQLDEKKGRYVFRPTTYYCATQDSMVLSENRFPKLANAAPLDERVRRRPEAVLAAVFERIGEQVGSGSERRYMAILDDLLAVANVERPMNADLIRSLVASPQYPEFSADPDVEDVFYYQPLGE